MKKCLLLLVVLLLVAGSANAALKLHWQMDSADDFALGDGTGGSYAGRLYVDNKVTGVKYSGMTSDTANVFFDAAAGALRMQTAGARSVMGQLTNDPTAGIFTSGTQYTFSVRAKADMAQVTGNGYGFYVKSATGYIFKSDLSFKPANAACFGAPGASWENNAYNIWDPTKPEKYVDPTTWNMYTFTWDADNNMIRTYVNGILRASYAGPGGDVPSFNPATITSWGFGSSEWGANLPGGWYKDFRVYNNALTEAEVAALVPEPATLVLLGLGGLTLIRKRK